MVCIYNLQAGDIINVDVTAYYKGYHGDLNETFVVGEVDEESKKLTKIAYEVPHLAPLPPPCQLQCPGGIPELQSVGGLDASRHLLTISCANAVPDASDRCGQAGHAVSGDGRHHQQPC